MASVSYRNEENFMFNVFGEYLMAVERHEYHQLCSFESFLSKKYDIDIVAPLPNNERVLVYSAEK